MSEDPVQFRYGGWWYYEFGPYDDESAARQCQEHAEMTLSPDMLRRGYR